jgi:mannonate dehydratase
MIRRFAGRIAFGHVRNVKHFDNGDFVETSHRALDGDVNTIEIMKAYHDIGYVGYLRPDHGRSLWGETGRPGYGLYDRAMGIMYLLGAWDMLESQRSA